MKKSLKIISIIMIFVLSISMLGACGGGEDRLISATINDGTKKEYFKGEEFDFNSLSFELNYVKNGKEMIIPLYDYNFAQEEGLNLTVDGFDSSLISDSIPLTITIDGGTNFSGSLSIAYSVKILPAKVVKQELIIDNETRKKEYLVGDKFDSTGIQVKNIYSDGTEDIVAISLDSITGFDTSKAITKAHMDIKLNSDNGDTLAYYVSPGSDYKKYTHTFLTNTAYATAEFYYPTEYVKSTSNGLTVFTSTDKGNFNILKDKATNYESFNQEQFETGLNSEGITIDVTGFKKTILNRMNVAIIDYSFDYIYGSVNLGTFNQRTVWIFGSSYTLIFTFTFPSQENPDVSDIFDTIIGSITI